MYPFIFEKVIKCHEVLNVGICSHKYVGTRGVLASTCNRLHTGHGSNHLASTFIMSQKNSMCCHYFHEQLVKVYNKENFHHLTHIMIRNDPPAITQLSCHKHCFILSSNYKTRPNTKVYFTSTYTLLWRY
jgi:hypothetical protein